MVVAPPILNPIDQLIDKYCVTKTSPAIRPGIGETGPIQDVRGAMGNHRTQAFIDGVAFFTAIEREIATLLVSNAGGRFFYVAAWYLDLAAINATLRIEDSWDFPLDTQGGFILPLSRQSLLSRLVDLARAGVDVRVMGWMSPFMTDQRVAKGSGKGDVNFSTLMSVDALRTQLSTAGRREHVILNMLAHSLGATHCKLVICGNQDTMQAYTSGLDPAIGRLYAPGVAGGWHDVGVKVEGNVATAIHDFYRRMWNEQLSRDVGTFRVNGRDIASHDRAWNPLPVRGQRVGLPPNTGQQFVQLLRTVPQMNFTVPSLLGKKRLLAKRGLFLVPEIPLPDKLQPHPRLRRVVQKVIDTFEDEIYLGIGLAAERRGFSRPKISFAPNGIFEFKVALRKAIASAEEYIFIADQSLFAFEIMDWIGDRMLRQPNLKVILFYGADPADPPNSLLAEAMNSHVNLGLPKDRRGQPSNLVFRQWDGNVVHSKVTLIDDTWCAIGSANCMRRSLYTDIELSVGILEPPTPTAQLPASRIEEANPGVHGKTAPSFVQKFRRELWAHYCGIPLDTVAQTRNQAIRFNALLPLNRALSIWKPGWGTPIPGVALRGEISRLSFPFRPDPDFPYSDLELRLVDSDSRETF